MSLQKKCPLCEKETLEKISPNEQFFSFSIEPQWICSNCGSYFTNENLGSVFKGNKISKREFFSIIFQSAKEVFHVSHLSKDIKEKIMLYYKGRIKAYYREIAEVQAELFYEIASKLQEFEMFGKVEDHKNKLK